MEGITTDEGTNDRENPAFLNRRLTEDLKRGVDSATTTDKAKEAPISLVCRNPQFVSAGVALVTLGASSWFGSTLSVAISV